MEVNYNISEIITEIYNEIIHIKDGTLPDYIPQLAKINPDLFGVSFCSNDGEQFNIGDCKDFFCLQSCCKPLNYCLSRSLINSVHQHVGYEPSGREFNSFTLNNNGIPHNPMINAGAIMTASLICPEQEPSKRFETVNKFYEQLAGGTSLGFDNVIYLSEQHNADRNTSLAYHMREKHAFAGNPSPNDIQNFLNLYFQCCSTTITSEIGAVIASTLANGGVCPLTNEKVISNNIVRDCLSLMYQCGMYDFSGQFAFKIGLPAKSGVSGGLLLVIPNVGGICVWSPPLDNMGNSVKGIEFCNKFVEKTNNLYHIFHGVTHIDEQQIIPENKYSKISKIITAASDGDIDYIKSIQNVEELSRSDYDGRTAMHLAAVDGRTDIVEYLITQGIPKSPKDRWGNTPYDEANKIRCALIPYDQKEKYNIICKLLQY